jgi:hypothetical protein
MLPYLTVENFVYISVSLAVIRNINTYFAGLLFVVVVVDDVIITFKTFSL